jgi:hypothetical protein
LLGRGGHHHKLLGPWFGNNSFVKSFFFISSYYLNMHVVCLKHIWITHKYVGRFYCNFKKNHPIYAWFICVLDVWHTCLNGTNLWKVNFIVLLPNDGPKSFPP